MFGTGRMVEEFADASFELEKDNDVSAPFKTQFGWHIVKLIKKHAQKSFEEEKYALEQRIKKDKRANVINSSVVKKLRRNTQLLKVLKLEKTFRQLQPKQISLLDLGKSQQILNF